VTTAFPGVTTRFILVRHGETEWNVEARVQGQRDSVLTAEGIAQVDAIARRIAEEPFDALVSSDLGRALDTARRISARSGRAIVSDPRLRERHFGIGEGMTYDEIGRAWPDAFARTREADADFAIPGGESRRAFHERVVAAFEALAREHAGRRVVVVTHGGVLATIHRHIHGIAIATPHKVPITNACYNVIACEAGCWRIEAWGDDAHLAVADPFEED